VEMAHNLVHTAFEEQVMEDFNFERKEVALPRERKRQC